MADLTAGRKPIDDRAAALKRRKMELQFRDLETQVLRYEIEIAELEDNVERRRESIVATQKQIAEITALLLEGTKHNG